MERRFSLSADDAVLPRGSRVVTVAAAVDVDGVTHRAGVHVTVKDQLAPLSPLPGRSGPVRYRVESVKGAVLDVDRSILALEKPDLLAALALREHDHARLGPDSEHVVLAVVVGSQAWGLAGEGSDEDVRGCFVLPFDDFASVYDAPDEIHRGEEAYWEVGKLVRQGLRADPNTLETLWSPLVKHEHGVGVRLRAERDVFSSLRVVDSFGRYAQSQLHKLSRSVERRRHLGLLLDEIAVGRASTEREAQKLLPKHEEPHALVRSLFDRGLLAASSYAALLDAVRELGAARLLPEEVRPKNAYNLVRLLHSCAHWIVEGTPLITVTGPLRDQLLDIKLSRISLDETMDRARLAADHVDALLQSTKSPLPTEPDVVAADNILRQARRDAARTVFSLSVGVAAVSPAETPALLPERHSDRFVCRFAPTPLPLDVDLKALREFLSDKAKKLPGPFLVVGLTGAHAYGFPSPDSDLDLKAIHAATAKSLLSLSPKTDPLELVEDWRGREMDLSSHELHQAAQLLLKGNGNMLERLLGPCVVLRSPAGEELTSLAQKTLSRRVVHHYRGFFERMLTEHEKLKTTTGSTAKKLLYAYRVALTGAHLLAAGELITDVRTLAPRHGFDVAVLLEQKKNRETAPMVDDSFFAADVVRLRALLDASLKNSVLPEHPDERAVAALDEFVGDTGIEVGTRVGVGVGVVDG